MLELQTLKTKALHTKVNAAFLDCFRSRGKQGVASMVRHGRRVTHYLPGVDLWVAPGTAPRDKPRFFWNAFGPGEPFLRKSISPSVEINLAFEPGLASNEGRFLRDSRGTIWVGHTGRLGGNKGLTKAKFLEYCGGGDLVLLDGRREQLLLLGNLDEPDELIIRVAQLAHDAKDARDGLSQRGSWTECVLRGAGFGEPERNTVVEAAAIAAVRGHYEAQGWSVVSVEREKVGYDLQCTQGSDELHVEVKGISGAAVEFIITHGEYLKWRSDRRFVLAAVTAATSAPIVQTYDAASCSRFAFTPLAYRAALKE